jgi:hypothetical protein
MGELAGAVLSVVQSARMIRNTDARTFTTYEAEEKRMSPVFAVPCQIEKITLSRWSRLDGGR